MSDFVYADMPVESTDHEGNPTTNTQPMLKLSDIKMQGKLAATAYMTAGGESSRFSDKLNLMHQWISTYYSVFQGFSFDRFSYTPDGIYCRIEMYPGIFISLYDAEHTLIGWAYGMSAQIPRQ
jgi:hypothetical protein